MRRFLRHGLALTCVGLAIGLGVSMLVTRLMASLLFEVSPLDPLTYLVVALVLMAVAAMASDVPARRASTVPLIEVLAEQVGRDEWQGPALRSWQWSCLEPIDGADLQLLPIAFCAEDDRAAIWRPGHCRTARTAFAGSPILRRSE